MKIECKIKAIELI